MPTGAEIYPREAAGRLRGVEGTRRNRVAPGTPAHRVRAVLLIGLLVLAGGAPCLAEPAVPGGDAPALSSALVQGPADFEECVRLALRQSPFLLKSSLEIEVRRLDETDSRYALVPPLSFRTYYYVNHPHQQDLNPRAYSLQFVTDPYNPFESYFVLQGRKLITQIAILGHLQIISEGLQRLGKMFLELDTLKRVDAWQDELISLTRQNLDYAEKRLSMGSATSLEVRVAAQEVELAQSEKDRITASRKRVLQGLKSFLGLKPDQELTPDLREARQQVLGRFDAAAATLDQARARSYELKIQDIKKQLQAYKITLAKAKLLPSLLLGVQTPDPLSLTEARGLYFSVGLDVPVWDGFKRVRDISRQKTILRQFGAEAEEKDLEFGGKWLEAQENLRSAAAARKMAQAQEELTRLKERQSEIRYQSGGEPLSIFLEGRKGNLEARKIAALKSLEYDLAVLSLRHLSGDLGNRYVQASSWQQ